MSQKNEHENKEQDTRTDRERWKQRLENSPERKEEFQTRSGIPIDPLYTPEDLDDFDYDEDLGMPGEFPFTRGPYHSMYRGRRWTMRQFAGFGTAEDTNERYHYLLDKGQTGLSVAFDMPTLMGLDSDHKLSRGEVGREGVAVSHPEDMRTLFDGIDLSEISTSMTINGPAAILLGYYYLIGREQGIDGSELRGTTQNDILKEYQAQKEFIFPPEPSMKLVTDTIEFCTEEMPKWHPVSISGYHIREAGSTALEELAFTLANGFEYVRWAQDRGLDIDEFGARLSFFFNSHMDFFEEVAKFRAARRIWARHMKDEFGATNEDAMKLRFHTQTAGVSLTEQQPMNNVVRTAYEALAAVLGGTQSLHTNSYDEALALPSEKAVKIALRTQQIIAEETNVTDTIDPLAGSYYVESLTDEMEEKAEEYFDEIESRGGVIECIREGYFQNEISQSAYEHQKKVEDGERIIVGVNKYREENEDDHDILKIGEDVEERQKERLQRYKSERSSRAVDEAIDDLKHAAEAYENLMYPIINAADAGVTLGETVDCLKDVYGTWEEVPSF